MKNKISIPIWKKTNLTVDEAAAYCGIGVKKLRKMTESEDCPFVLWNGTKRLIKRQQLDEYLESMSSISSDCQVCDRSIRIIGLSPTLNYDMNIKNKEVHQKWQIQNLMCRYGIKQT